jgi:hypothetical protein
MVFCKPACRTDNDAQKAPNERASAGSGEPEIGSAMLATVRRAIALVTFSLASVTCPLALVTAGLAAWRSASNVIGPSRPKPAEAPSDGAVKPAA